MKIIMDLEDIMDRDEIVENVQRMKSGDISKGACIRAMFAGGLSVKDIATETSIRYNHVYNVCKNEVTKHHLESAVSMAREGRTKKEQILDLLRAGKTITEVSKDLGCLYNQVWQVAKAGGFTNKQKAQVVNE